MFESLWPTYIYIYIINTVYRLYAARSTNDLVFLRRRLRPLVRRGAKTSGGGACQQHSLPGGRRAHKTGDALPWGSGEDQASRFGVFKSCVGFLGPQNVGNKNVFLHVFTYMKKGNYIAYDSTAVFLELMHICMINLMFDYLVIICIYIICSFRYT